MLALLASLAHAAPLVPAFDGAHTWKVEVYWYAPAMNAWSSDYRDEEMEATAVTLACKPSGRPRIDHCAPVDGKIWWGYRLAGEPEVTLHELTTAGVLEIGYNERGRVVRSDWIGDRSGFYADACHALMYLDKTMNPVGFVCTVDSARRVGPRFEENVAANVLGALDLELPKNGDPGGKPWKPSTAPLGGRRYGSTSMASTAGTWTVVPGTPEKIRFEGKISERPVNAGSMASGYTTDSAVQITATLGADGRPREVEAHAAATSTGPIYGFAQTDIWLTTVDAPASAPPGADPRQPPAP